MFAINESSRAPQRVVCMLMALFIVTTSLSLGAYGVHKMEHPGYLVTITQVQ